MKQLKVWVLLALVFLAGFVGGVVVTRVAVRHFVSRAIANPGLIRSRIERALDRRLQLDPQQEKQVHQILVESQSRLQAVRQSVQPQVASVVQDTRKEIAAILTPEQREKFDKLAQESHRFWQAK